MQMLFLDFICFRGPHLEASLPGYFEASHAWLEAATTAAMDLGLEVQYCMACPHQAMASLDWPAVTNARVNGDSGMAPFSHNISPVSPTLFCFCGSFTSQVHSCIQHIHSVR